MDAELVNTVPGFYGTRRFITVSLMDPVPMLLLLCSHCYSTAITASTAVNTTNFIIYTDTLLLVLILQCDSKFL
jgi:hypothetical protein